MITFTKEQLIEWAKDCRMLAQCAVDARPDNVAAAKNLALAEIVLASLDAKPVYQYRERTYSEWQECSERYYQIAKEMNAGLTRVLYTAPPAPVDLVNDAYLESLVKEQEANLKAAEYELKKNATQAMDYSADREMLKRLAVIMSGNDSPGEIRSLTVTAQSLVDRCKALARDKEALPSDIYTLWRPASPDEINKRSIRESTNIDSPSREAIVAGGVLVQCPRCHGDSYRLNFNGWAHFWCDKCANAITSEGK
ncbi:hypothetical protein R4R92_004480 [Citrobacter freundii]|uniref:hypothetical protein n=1 Tax=Citrobacter freundii TaxID=546 RepID=UPI0028DAEB71|nr:hypothetical protein [Citrobacter freundii]ELR9593949.1 hypothetical protein [Citrobacter freundii]HEH9868173.1 hypothetical protein [Citrobacter freundii]